MADHDTKTSGVRDESSWLRQTPLEELYRVARLCDIDLDEFPVNKRNLSREDMITILQSSRENEVTDAQFRELIRPPITFDVKNAQLELEEQLDATQESLRGEIKPLKDFKQRVMIWAAIATGIAGILGSFLLNSILNISELETSMKTELEEANNELDSAKYELGQARDNLNKSQGEVAELKGRLDKSLKSARQSNEAFQEMIIALSTHTGIQMIGKLNARLDRLRSMKVYHLKPLMNELALDTESDARTLTKLEKLLEENRPRSDEHELLVSLNRITRAIRDLKLIYDQDDKIDMERLRRTRRQWSLLRSDISIVELKLHTMLEDRHRTGTSGNLPRLKANVYQVEAGLSIQQYRAGDEDEKLLQKARDNCTAAIAEDPSAAVAHLYNGLISSLRISRFRDQRMDPNDRIQVVEKAKNRGLESYRVVSRVTTPPELKIYALNGEAYLMVKTSNIYAEAAKNPECLEYKEAYAQTAADLLATARKEIRQAEQGGTTVDPIVLTTQADIEILSLQFNDPENPDATYAQILDLLQRAVSQGYTGYTGPKDVFFEKRPHFRYLEKLKPQDYEDDVCRAVGIQ